uniref:Macrophage migration inhibitory factor n=1 Tax=Ficedula albicollis TaxID=59894 RepID=A0A803VRJ2_FICAL
MPKFIANTNLSKDKIPESFSEELTQQLPKALGKPAQVSAFQVVPQQGLLGLCCTVMSFGGSTDCCIGEQENKVCSKLLCDLLNKQLKIPSDSPGCVGWNSTTFD